jgi:hypothetical protein
MRGEDHMPEETDARLASTRLAEALIRAYTEWNRAHPEATTATAVHGFIDGGSRMLFRFIQGAGIPSESMEALDEILSRLRRRVLEREP